MRDFPVFDTPYGVAGLTMKEIPYRACAYIRIHTVFSENVEALLNECASFCRACGAERIYATGHDALQSYPVYTTVYEMSGQVRVDSEKAAFLFPVTQETVAQWRSVYNERMRMVDNASTLEARDEKKILDSAGAYFIHRNGELLGIGWIEENRLNCVAACIPGMGECVMHTLLSLADEENVRLEVASTNVRAISLYERMGFVKTKELTRWYRVSAAKKTEK